MLQLLTIKQQRKELLSLKLEKILLENIEDKRRLYEIIIGILVKEKSEITLRKDSRKIQVELKQLYEERKKLRLVTPLTKQEQNLVITKRTTNDQEISNAEREKGKNKFVLNKLEDELEELIRQKHSFDTKLENTYNRCTKLRKDIHTTEQNIEEIIVYTERNA
jgi:hypothetical protein